MKKLTSAHGGRMNFRGNGAGLRRLPATLLAFVIAAACGDGASPGTTTPLDVGDPPPVDVGDPNPANKCPASWTADTGTRIDFTGPPPSATGSAPFAAFIQGTDGDRGVPNEDFATMMNASFADGGLVLLGKSEDVGQQSYLAALSDLKPSIAIGLKLDVSNERYQSIAGQLAGLEDFRQMLETQGGGYEISSLVYDHDGGTLTAAELIALSGQMPSGVSLSVSTGIGGAIAAPPTGWTGPYAVYVEAYGLFSHDCDHDAVAILVDGPAGGASLCSRGTYSCKCTPSGSQSIYQVCAAAPAQAGRIAGYLASLKTVPVDDSLDGIVFTFSFEPSLDDPTVFPSNWGPSEYAEFADGFAEMIRSQTGATSGTIAMGTWDMTAEYAQGNGWLTAR